MASGLNPLTTVLDAVSPLIVGNSEETAITPKTEATLLTPRGATSPGLVDRANTFAPPANIDLLAPSASSVLLTEQAREKPVILQNLDSRAQPAFKPLGNFDIYRELLDKAFAPGKTQRDAPSFRAVQPDTPARTPQALRDAFRAFDAAQSLRQSQPDAAKPDYIGSSFDITA